MLSFIKSAKAKLSEYFDVVYLFKFLFLLFGMYYFHVCYIAIIDKQGMAYSAFLDNHFNYITWLRNAILYPADLITRGLGLHSYISLPYRIRTVNGSYVEMVYSCLGLNLMSFWMAFVIADKESVRRKIGWCAAGILGIWFINMWRVVLLLIANEYHWKVNATLDHHSQFNIVAYSLIAFMIWLYLRDSKKAPGRRTTNLSVAGA